MDSVRLPEYRIIKAINSQPLNIMKKKFINSFAGRLITGAISAVPYVGQSINAELKSNTDSPASGKGNIDHIRLFGYGIVSALFVLKIIGLISWDDLNEFIKIIMRME